jgi:ABC-2 type transport system permease protein
MWSIAKRELQALFLSPLAWSILAVVQIILGLVFAVRVSMFLESDFQAQLSQVANPPGVTSLIAGHVYVWASIVFMLVTPLLTMRVVSEERRNKTLALLISAPVSMTQIILGKYLALLIFFGIMASLISLMPLSLLVGGVLDMGQLFSGFLGLLLLTAAFAAIGLYISTLTAHPTVAAISTFGSLLLLWMIDWAGGSEEQSGLLGYLSLTNHYQMFLKGLLSTSDAFYYLLLISLFLILSIQRLDSDRI